MNETLDAYNVVWDSPSKDASGSMPLGNGDLGANVWVEAATGDLLLLIGKTDAWDENSINLKLGRIRISLVPNPLMSGARFRQTLRLRSGEIEIVADSTTIRIWVDANQPVIRIDASSDRDFEVQASLEIWRTQPRQIKTQTGDLFRNLGGADPYPTIITADELLRVPGQRIAWCHHNSRPEHDGFEINLKLQGLGGMLGQMPHPLAERVFGASMQGDGFILEGPQTLKSAARRQHRLEIYALTMHPATIQQWSASLDQKIEQIQSIDLLHARQQHEQWWEQFWERSWTCVRSADEHDEQEIDAARDVTRGYILQRFMNACGGRGEQPIKFNGSIFTVGQPDDPDFRRWGGPGFWFMNTRLIYWPMLASGDFDLMRAWARMYLDMLPLQRHRTRAYYGHGGAHFPETITFWGAEVSAHYGWTPFEQREHPEAECSYVTYYWSCGIELTLMLWTYFTYTSDEPFAREFLLPIADKVTEFYDLHYPRDEKGRIKFEPAQALETWQDATNPLPEIAGLRYVLPKLIELPPHLTTEAQRRRWGRMLTELPPIPVGVKDGQQVILPAERFEMLKNTENPELYGVFPYRLFGVGKPDLQLARETFAARLHRSHDCWSQDDVQMALLGLAGQVKEYLSKRASPASHSDSRFPAFWNQFHDWVPDIDHGGVLQLALQFMLMQCEGRQIRLLPAWPREWDVDFKLHAPYQTLVAGKVCGGRIVELHVTPPSRRADVVIENEPD